MVRNVSTVQHIKSSKLIYIPKNICDELNIKQGDIYRFSIDGNKIIMSPLKEQSHETGVLSPA